MATIFPIPTSTIVPGAFSFGPATLNSGVNKIALSLDISPVTNNCVLNAKFQISSDGGNSYQDNPVLVGLVITNGTVGIDGGLTDTKVDVSQTLSPLGVQATKVKFAGVVSGGSLKTGANGTITLS